MGTQPNVFLFLILLRDKRKGLNDGNIATVTKKDDWR